MSNSKKLQCPDSSCLKTFEHASSLSRHKRESHPQFIRSYSYEKKNAPKPNPKEDDRNSHVICGEANWCNISLPNQKALMEHLKELHNRTDIKTEVKSFASEEEFKYWIAETERDHIVNFVASRGEATRKSGWKVQNFYCSRSHSCERQGSGKRAPHITKKSGYRCSSYLTAKRYEDGHVDVDFCLQHSGHKVDAAKLALNEKSRELIASYIRSNHTSQWIADKLQKLYSNENDRNFFINSKDIANVRQKYQLHPGRLHQDDMQSVAEWVRRDKVAINSGEWENLFAYRQAIDESGKNFRLGLMTEGQAGLLRDFAHKGVAVDGTHNTTRYDFKLITLLVLDDRQAGRPVAHFLCPQETTPDLKEFFEHIKQRYGGPISADVFMSDDASQMWTAWVEAMGEEATRKTKKLLCTWHVLKNWHENVKSKISNKELREEIVKWVDMLTRTSDRNQFRKSVEDLEQFLIDKKEIDFLNYFRTYYTGEEDRVEQWAPYARVNAPFNTNMALERFHRHLKQNYLLKSENRRMDYTIFVLLQAAAASSRASIVQLARNVVGFRQQTSHDRHRRAMEKYQNNLNKIEKLPNHNVWVVQSRTNNQKFYAVQFVKECECKVEVNCRYCSVCFDEFQCDCPDGVKAGFACAHIHGVQMKIEAEPNTNPRPSATSSKRAQPPIAAVATSSNITVEAVIHNEQPAEAVVILEDPSIVVAHEEPEDVEIVAHEEPENVEPVTIAQQQGPFRNWRTECIATLQLLQGGLESLSDEQGTQFLAALKEFSDKAGLKHAPPIRVQPRPDVSNAHALPQRIAKRTEILKKRRKQKSRQTCRPSEAVACPISESDNDPDENDFVAPRQKSLLHSEQFTTGNKRQKTTNDPPPNTKTTRSFASICSSAIAKLFKFYKRQTKIDKARATLANVNRETLKYVEAYMQRNDWRAPGVEKNPIRAAKILKNMIKSKRFFDKAVDCYLSQNGGMFIKRQYSPSRLRRSSRMRQSSGKKKQKGEKLNTLLSVIESLNDLQQQHNQERGKRKERTDAQVKSILSAPRAPQLEDRSFCRLSVGRKTTHQKLSKKMSCQRSAAAPMIMKSENRVCNLNPSNKAQWSAATPRIVKSENPISNSKPSNKASRTQSSKNERPLALALLA